MLSRPDQCAPHVSRLAELTFSVLRCAVDLVLATQYASEARHVLYSVARALPQYPQMALAKLYTLLAAFPPSSPQTPEEPSLSPRAMGRLMIVLHPGLLHAPFQAWALLSERFEEVGLGPLAAPLATEDADAAGTVAEDAVGLLGYTVRSIARSGKHTARIVFVCDPSGLRTRVSVSQSEREYQISRWPFQARRASRRVQDRNEGINLGGKAMKAQQNLRRPRDPI
jgi:hypothetical protein